MSQTEQPTERQRPVINNDEIFEGLDSPYRLQVEAFFYTAISRNSYKLMGDERSAVIGRLAGVLERLDIQATPRMLRVFVAHATVYNCVDRISPRVLELLEDSLTGEPAHVGMTELELVRALQSDHDVAEALSQPPPEPEPAVVSSEPPPKRVSQKAKRRAERDAGQAAAGFGDKTPKFAEVSAAAE